MAKVMKASEFTSKLKDIATNYKTLYVMACFGAPMTDKNKTRYCNNHDYNRKESRRKMIKAASSDTFGFDCVCLIKGVLWGWNGNTSKTYGGASYKANGVPDTNADGMIKLCTNVTTDFSKIEVGEAVWQKGHIGIYIGDGLAVECTPAWKNKVQITAVKNIGTKSGYNARTWTKHGKLPYIEYDVAEPNTTPSKNTTSNEKFKVGDVIQFIGNRHYTNPNATSGPSIKPSRAKITDIADHGKHPYHVRAVDSSGKYVGGVYGWVDANAITKVTSGSSSITIESAQKKDLSIAGDYKTTGNLRVRAGAGITKKHLATLKKGSIVHNYGYYTMNGSTKWLYVTTEDGITGFCSTKYLKKC